MSGEYSGIRKALPEELGEEIKRLVIGYMPTSLAPGLLGLKATLRFQCGDLFFTLLDALIHEGDEFSVGGRSIKLEEGQELWVVSLRTKEDVTCLEHHNNPPSTGAMK